jgi:hypothetical protein
LEHAQKNPTILEDTHAAPAESRPVTIVAIAAPATTIDVAAIGEVGTEQEVLSDTEATDDCDDIILDLSGINTNTSILLHCESFKPDCIFWTDLKRKSMSLWRDWHSGIGAIHEQSIAKDLEKRLDLKPKE